MSVVHLSEEPFDPWGFVAAHQQAHAELAGRHGACAVFVGSMRDFNQGDAVQSMLLEHYPGMTERSLERIAAAAGERWPLLDSLIVHRVGTVRPGDPIVLVAVWSEHRKAAFEASRFVMEELKSRAPLWKKERLDSGERWVEQNTPG